MSSQDPARKSGSIGAELAQITAGGVILGALVVLLMAGRFAEHRTLALAAMLVAGVAWCLAVLLARRGAGRIGFIVALAIAMRLVALGGDLGLSDDLWRYGWEGGLVLEGKSPYAEAPDSPALASERERWAGLYERMNNKDISAAYPPVTQYFAAAVVAASNWAASEAKRDDAAAALRLERAMRFAFSLVDLLVLLPLLGLLRRRGLPDGLAITWAWSPLVIWEFGSSAHFDSLGILALLAAVWVLANACADEPESKAQGPQEKTRSALGGALLSLAFMTKYLPLIAAPFLLLRGKLGATLAAVASFALVTALGFASLLWLDGGLHGVLSGLGEYGLRWESWNLVYRWIEPLFDSLGERTESLSDPRRLGRLTIGAAAGLYVLWLMIRRTEPLRAIFLTLAAFLILTPTLHPWYVTWILPFAAFVPTRTAAAWLWLATVSPLLYWPLTEWQARGEWIEPSWSWPVVAIPFFLLLVFGALRKRQTVAAP